MRLALLELLAFGPFKGLTLDFSIPREGLHVLYGPNEAGKSTALRAVTGLLYGIPARTVDAHFHAPQDLRIGAHLEGCGESLSIVRRKGLRNTLLDPAGNPIDETALRRLLGGVGEALFRTMFGLDHETLRQGAQALLEGHGDVGESLLGAAVGGSGLHRIRKELREEADALFTPQAQKKPLNEALRAFTEAQKKARLEPTSAAAWEAQKRGVEEAIEDTRRLEQEARALRAERHRLQRAARAVPLLAQQRELERRRAALGEVVLLPAAAGPERLARQRDAAQARHQAERLSHEIAELEAERAALVVPEALTAADEAIDSLPSRLGSYRKAQLDLPRVHGEAEHLTAAVHTILRRLGHRTDTPLEELERLRVEAKTQARIRKLAAEAAVVEQRLAQARADLVLRRAKETQDRERLAELAATNSRSELADTLTRAQHEGDLEERLRTAEATLIRLREAVRGQRRALGLPESLADPAAAQMPSLETVERFEQLFAQIAKGEALLAERQRALGARVAEIDRDVDALQRAGSVPTEGELGEARTRRDETWRALRRANRRIDAAAADVFEQRLRDSDDLADRLRREAARVTSLARLLADRTAAASERARLEEEERRSLGERTGEVAAAWCAAWVPAGVEPHPPTEMRAWLARHATLSAQTDQLREAERDVATLQRRRETLVSELQAVLADEARGQSSLAALVAMAQRASLATQAAARKREELERGLEELAQEIARLAQAAAQHERAVASWRAAWAECVGALGLAPNAIPEEATAVLAELGELFPKLEELSRVRRRIAGIERDATQFADDVANLALVHAPEIARTPPEQAAAELTRRTQQARTDRATLEQIERQLADKRRAHAEHEALRAAAEARLDELLRVARADNVDALERAERRSAEAESIDAELRELDRSLLRVAEGSTSAALAAETAGLDADAIAAELERRDLQIEETEQRQAIKQRSIGDAEAGLRALETKSVAADAAAEAQEALARVRMYVDRYVRIKLAGAVLGREIERYREENQGPVLGRASELFRRLTLGSFAALRAGWGERDEAVLRCVREDGRELGVEALSDGARDQLYLALRLASLERFTEGNESMPLVVDDVLIHFDDDRAKAALGALADLASRTQILFFTHHARLVELAREAVPADRLREHRLG